MGIQRPEGQMRRWGSNALDLAALSVLLLVGIVFVSGVTLSGGYRIYSSIATATWVLLFAAAVGRSRSRRGGVWILALVSPLCALGPLLALGLLDRRLRESFVRDLTRAWSSLAPASFPLGAPTGKRLILAAATAAGVFVGDVAVMAIWLGLAGGSPSSTFALWFVFAPAAVLSLLTLTYFVAGWLVARRRLAESSSQLLGSVLLLLLALALGSGCGGHAAAPPAIGNSLGAAPARNGLIAYESNVAGPIEIYVMNPDGTRKRRLTHSGDNGEPSWSPDGRRLVFVHGACATLGCSRPSALSVMNADGSDQRRLTNGRTADNDARWSPDGNSIAFTRGSCDQDVPADSHCDIWLIRPDGSDERALTRDGRSAEPAWSPDGTKIAFAHENGDGSRLDIYVMKTDGTGEHNLTTSLHGDNAGSAEPSWSPDGRTIAFTVNDEILAFVTPAGSNLRHLNASVPESEPAWSPDGKWIVFQTQQTLWTVNFPTATRQRRVAYDGDNHNPAWQPLRGAR